METEENLAARLVAMFEDSPRNAGRHLPPYQFDAALGSKPWWPDLASVWAAQGKPDQDNTAIAAWPDAWALLRGLHEHYMVSKGAIGGTQ